MIASDGGLLEKPVPLQRIQLSPAERAEIIVELAPGEPVMLRGYPMDRWTDETWRQRFGLTESFDILALRPTLNLHESPTLPATLATLPSATPPAGAPIRRFHLQRGTDAAGKNVFKINDQLMDMARIDFNIADGAHEIWEITAGDRVWPHNFHIHDTQFRILDIDGAPPPPELAGYKDTVFIYPQTTVRLAVRFSGYTDPINPYMYHCHMLFHEDQGMMGQFRTLAPGQQPGSGPVGPGMHS
jgi:bilirubin oxidase